MTLGLVIMFMTVDIPPAAFAAIKGDRVIKKRQLGITLTAEDYGAAFASFSDAAGYRPSGRYLREKSVAAIRLVNKDPDPQKRDRHLRLIRADLLQSVSRDPVGGLQWYELSRVERRLTGSNGNSASYLARSFLLSPNDSWERAGRSITALKYWTEFSDDDKSSLENMLLNRWRMQPDRIVLNLNSLPALLTLRSILSKDEKALAEFNRKFREYRR